MLFASLYVSHSALCLLSEVLAQTMELDPRGELQLIVLWSCFCVVAVLVWFVVELRLLLRRPLRLWFLLVYQFFVDLF
jgi:hypothetical protein